MRVFFLQDVQGVALAGEVKEVANGYARNYLFPKGLATLATPHEMRRVEQIKKAGEEKRLKEQKNMESVATALEGKEVVIKARLAPGGEFYGAIGSSEIARELSKMLERPVDRKSIAIVEPAKTPGTYEFTVRLHTNVSAKLKLTAAAE